MTTDLPCVERSGGDEERDGNPFRVLHSGGEVDENLPGHVSFPSLEEEIERGHPTRDSDNQRRAIP